NTGTAKANVWINYAMPIGLRYLNAFPPLGNIIGRTYTWDFPNRAPGPHSLWILATVDSDIENDVTLNASVELNYTDSIFSLYPVSTDSASTTIAFPAFTLYNWADTDISYPGEIIVYTVTFTNFKKGIASYVWINDTYPSSEVTYLSDTSGSILSFSALNTAENRLIYVFRNVTKGEYSFEISFKIGYGVNNGMQILNMARIEFTDVIHNDYFQSADERGHQLAVYRPVISAVIVADKSSAEVNELINYRIYFNNTGGNFAGEYGNATIVWLNLTVAGLTYVSDNSALLTDVGSSSRTETWRWTYTDVRPGEHYFNVVAEVNSDLLDGYVIGTEAHLSYALNGITFDPSVGLVEVILKGPAPDALPMLIAVMGIVGVGSMFMSENTKYRFYLFFLPLMAKLRKKDVLEHETRGLIRGYIIANPGDHFNSIKKALALNNGTLAYHLHVLEKEGMVRSRRFGKFTRLFPSGMRIPENGSRYSEIQAMIMDKIKETPGITQKEIATIIGVTKPTINYHVGKLQGDGVVEGRRFGIQIRYFLTGKGNNF
ncbi:MAG: winged helix-turn-helix transcriptional regulator, partial [Thermoplasmata archaeon]|nr:winged helix-turn-helix transcriptional regulator [Thermoplasmata archaeon]